MFMCVCMQVIVAQQWRQQKPAVPRNRPHAWHNRGLPHGLAGGLGGLPLGTSSGHCRKRSGAAGAAALLYQGRQDAQVNGSCISPACQEPSRAIGLALTPPHACRHHSWLAVNWLLP